jgi:hypothetical protein
VYPNIVLILVGDVRPIKSEGLDPELRKHSIRGENLVLVRHEHVGGGVVEQTGIDVILAAPLFLNHSVHDLAIENAVQVVLVQVPEAVVTLVVCLLNQLHHFVWVIVNVQAFLHLKIEVFFHQVS